MKYLVFTVLLFLSFLQMKAQVSLPEFNEKPAYYDQNSKKLVELERSQYNMIAKAKGLFSAEAGFFLEGTTSDVKIKNELELQFIVKVLPGIDAAAVFDLGKFEVRKGKRVFITSVAKIASNSTSYQKIKFDVVKIKEGFYYVNVRNLSPGEYFFGSKDAMYAFAVQ